MRVLATSEGHFAVTGDTSTEFNTGGDDRKRCLYDS